MGKTLKNIIRNSNILFCGAGLYGLVNFSGCSVLENASDAELLAAGGTAISIGASNQIEAIIGGVAQTLGNNQVQKEIAREGKTEVNVYNNQGQQQNNSQNVYTQRLFTFNKFIDFNNDKTLDQNEFFGLGKKEFELNKETISISYCHENCLGNVIFRSWTSKGDLIGETLSVYNKPNRMQLFFSPPNSFVPDGDFMDKLRCAGPGEYKITATNGKGETYFVDIITK